MDEPGDHFPADEEFVDSFIEDLDVSADDIEDEIEAVNPLADDIEDYTCEDLEADGVDDMDFEEEFAMEDEYLDSFSHNLLVTMQDQTTSRRRRRRFIRRRFVPRTHEYGATDLFNNYFRENPIYTDEMFRRRFRMRCPLFLRLLTALQDCSPFFTDRVDAIGRQGITSLQKCTAAIRMLAYGTPTNQLDDQIKLAASTTLECLGKFAKGVIEIFGPKYLRPPTAQELEQILQENESRGFPGMLGSIDYMHWAWEKCPVAWRGQFTRGDKGVPTMILQAIASKNLQIWHAFFGTAGSNNDINVLNRSLFIETLRGEAPKVQYTVNENQYDTGYYLADRIYPEWAAFVKTVKGTQTDKDKLFAKRQESARKDVECAFSGLQSRFNIVHRPTRLWERRDVVNIMQACVILHNMIVEDEKELVRVHFDLNENPGASIALPPKVSNNPNPCFAKVLQRNAAIRARSIHVELKNDLIEHIWNRFGKK